MPLAPQILSHNDSGSLAGEEAGGRVTQARCPGGQCFEKSALAQARLHRVDSRRGTYVCPRIRPVSGGHGSGSGTGRGARVEDLDGNSLMEYGMGLRAITLGHGYEPVVDAVCSGRRDGVNFSRPSIWELVPPRSFSTRCRARTW